MRWADTLSADHIVHPDEPHSLGHMGYRWLDIAPWKPPKNRGGMLVYDKPEDLHLYNARDTVVTLQVMQALRVKLKRDNLEDLFESDMLMAKVCFALTVTGMPWDIERARERGEAARAQAQGAIVAMREIASKPELNPNSPVQLVSILYAPEAEGGYGLEPMEYTETAARLPRHLRWKGGSTKESALRAHRSNLFVAALIEYQSSKGAVADLIGLNEDSTPTFQPFADNRVRATWNPAGSRSGRWTSSPNLLNRSKEFRELVVAPRGRKLVGADFAQLELRITGAASGDRAFCERLLRADESRKLSPDHDPHALVASLAFGQQFFNLPECDPAHYKAQKGQPKCRCGQCARAAMREAAKRFIYGANYLGGAERLRAVLYEEGYSGPPLSLLDCKNIVLAIKKAFPGIQARAERAVREANTTNRVVNPIDGRKRDFPLRIVPAPEAANFEIQSIGASIVNGAMAQIYRGLNRVDASARLIAQVHDAIVIECDEGRADPTAAFVEDAMTTALELHDGLVMPITASASIGDTWAEV